MLNQLKLINIYTDKEITVENVIAHEVKDYGTRVYIELNGNRDMTTYANYFPE